MMLVDTSVWVELASRPAPWHLEQEVVNWATCGPVLQELLQGLADAPANAVPRRAFLRLRVLSDPTPSWLYLTAAELYRRGRAQGYTIRSSADCLIAAIAIENGVPLWHCDRDYDLLARFTPLRAVRFPARA